MRDPDRTLMRWRDPERLDFFSRAKSAGCLWSVPLLIASTLLAIWIYRPGDEYRTWREAAVALWLVITSLGFGMFFYGCGVVLDRRQRLVIEWRGVALPWLFNFEIKIKGRPWNEYREVVFQRGGKVGLLDRHGHVLEIADHTPPSGEDGGPSNNEIASAEREARHAAGRAARFMGLNVRECAEVPRPGAPFVPNPADRVCSAETLDETLATRLRREGVPARLPRPEKTRMTVVAESSELILAQANWSGSIVHSRRTLGCAWVSLGVFSTPFLVMAIWIMRSEKGPEAIVIPLAIFLFIGVCFFSLRSGLGIGPTKEQLRVSSGSLNWERQYWPRGRIETTIPFSELRDLYVVNDCLFAQSDRERIVFGTMEPDECAWLRAEILARVAAGSAPPGPT